MHWHSATTCGSYMAMVGVSCGEAVVRPRIHSGEHLPRRCAGGNDDTGESDRNLVWFGLDHKGIVVVNAEFKVDRSPERSDRITTARVAHLRRFYDLLGELEERLSGTRRLCECSGSMSWPHRGVYFFQEPGEVRTGSGTGPRIVHVGTHAITAGSNTRLWGRLSQHRGSNRSGAGNHRSSVFRRLVGTALIARDKLECPTWDRDRAPDGLWEREREQALERTVSTVIGEMPFLWLAIGDEAGSASLRGYIKRNSVALLGNEPLDPPSRSWLGYHCDREKVRAAGIWNSNDVDKRPDPAFFDTLAGLIEQTERPG